ncbi:hypothetical protein [Frigoribacterium sp. NPDC087798]|uniref:hypothetical protein n=1 Tax=Frigoribacterium sp. NPDC087798 TaxID=3363993 RepID=UPI00382B3783
MITPNSYTAVAADAAQNAADAALQSLDAGRITEAAAWADRAADWALRARHKFGETGTAEDRTWARAATDAAATARPAVKAWKARQLEERNA